VQNTGTVAGVTVPPVLFVARDSRAQESAKSAVTMSTLLEFKRAIPVLQCTSSDHALVRHLALCLHLLEELPMLLQRHEGVGSCDARGSHGRDADAGEDAIATAEKPVDASQTYEER
jgi:hypothetical protein